MAKPAAITAAEVLQALGILEAPSARLKSGYAAGRSQVCPILIIRGSSAGLFRSSVVFCLASALTVSKAFTTLLALFAPPQTMPCAAHTRVPGAKARPAHEEYVMAGLVPAISIIVARARSSTQGISCAPLIEIAGSSPATTHVGVSISSEQRALLGCSTCACRGAN